MIRRAPLLLLAALLSACTSPEPEPLVVWSDVGEMAFVIERYNHIHEREVRFVPIDNLTQALTQRSPEADLVVGRWVNTPLVNRLILPYRSTLPSESYQAVDSRLLEVSGPWVPLSFNLPALYTRVETPLPGDPLRSSLADMGTLYGETGATLHFVPSLTPDTMYAVQRSLGFSVSVSNGEPLIRGLDSAMATVREWQNTYNGGLAAESAYIQRLLYERPERLLETGRTSVAYAASNRLLDWDFTGRRRYHFRWLASPDGTIHANEDVVYAGVPESSTRREAATQLLRFLLDPRAQQDLMTAKLAARVDSFGIYDGFSTLAEVNRFLAGEIIPDLAGRVPAPGSIVFPATLPRYWNEARTAVVAPFMIQSPDPEGLGSGLARWYNQRGD